MEIKKLFETKQFKNGIDQLYEILNKRWYTLEFFQKEDDVWFTFKKL